MTSTTHDNAPQPGMDSIAEKFWQQLRASARPLLMLDYDGTLAPFREKRDEAFPYEGLRPLLGEIRRNSRLVIVTGRPVRDVVPLLGLDPPPEIFGAHGWERLCEGESVPETIPASDKIRDALDKAAAWIHDNGHGPRSEHKAASVTIHWRAEAPHDADRLRAEARAAWEPLVIDGIELHAFDGGLEFRATGRTKGDAVRTLLAEVDGNTLAAFLGDDLTDEDAFAALRESDLAVLIRNEWRQTRATAWLRPPAELFEFLEKWKDFAQEADT